MRGTKRQIQILLVCTHLSLLFFFCPRSSHAVGSGFADGRYVEDEWVDPAPEEELADRRLDESVGTPGGVSAPPRRIERRGPTPAGEKLRPLPPPDPFLGRNGILLGCAAALVLLVGVAVALSWRKGASAQEEESRKIREELERKDRSPVQCGPRGDGDAFTIVELVVALGILVVLGGIAYPMYTNYFDNAREAVLKHNTRVVGELVFSFYLDGDSMTYKRSGSREGDLYLSTVLTPPSIFITDRAAYRHDRLLNKPNPGRLQGTIVVNFNKAGGRIEVLFTDRKGMAWPGLLTVPLS